MKYLVAALAIVAFTGCGDTESDPASTSTGSPPAETEPIGASGGTLTTADGVVVNIPSGALDADVEIWVATSSEPWPTTVESGSALYEFGPSGTTFASPITITIPINGGGDPELLTGYWSAAGGGELEAVPATVEGTTATIVVTHFSIGGIGSIQRCDATEDCEEGACAADAECTHGGVCSGNVGLSEWEWLCMTADFCASRCTGPGDACSSRNRCSRGQF